MNKKQKIMTSMKFRSTLTKAIEDVRFRDAEIFVMHYEKPVAKLVGLSEEEVKKIKIDMQKEKD